MVTITSGIQALPEATRLRIFALVMEFKDFTPDNDPYGEHDFGTLTVPTVGTVYWKIDYYDPSVQYGSEDPTGDPAQTTRVLTIILASEY